VATIGDDLVWMSGNEAIALAAYEAGVKVASGYPGTPSTEILENLSTYEGVIPSGRPMKRLAWRWPSAHLSPVSGPWPP